MSETTTNSSGPLPQAAQTGSSSETQVKFPRFYMVILFALVSIVFTAVWLGIYEFLNKAIWSNNFVTSNNGLSLWESCSSRCWWGLLRNIYGHQP
jgi:hypothetical protein